VCIAFMSRMSPRHKKAMFGGAHGIFLHCLFLSAFCRYQLFACRFCGRSMFITYLFGKLPSHVLVCKSAPLAMKYTPLA
jgi:hypothetical protein